MGLKTLFKKKQKGEVSPSGFYRLKIQEVKQETADAVSVEFEVPSDLANIFNYEPGQYLTFKVFAQLDDLRRSYSICSGPGEPLRIAVKKIEGGAVSTKIHETWKAGDEVKVMAPAGNFKHDPVQAENPHYVLFAAGSGITPILGILKTILAKEPRARVTLLYGNKTPETSIFRKGILALKAEAGERFNLKELFTASDTEPLLNGRFTEDKIKELAEAHPELASANRYYTCGPEDMILAVAKGLQTIGVSKEDIRFELFTTPTEAVAEVFGVKMDEEDGFVPFEGMCKTTLKLRGEEHQLELSTSGKNIVDAAEDAGLAPPFACKGAMCGACRGKVISGRVHMEMNYALSEPEVRSGYVLTCQSRPVTETLTLSYDD